MKLFDFLNGHKTVIGAIIHFIVGVIGLAQTTFKFQLFTVEQLAQLDQLAMVVITVGLAHKVYKQVSK